MALVLRRRVEEDVRDSFRRQVEVDVLRVAVRRAHLPVLELVAAFRVGLDQADDVMLPDEPESAGPQLHPGQGVFKVHPNLRAPLDGVPPPGTWHDAGHAVTPEVDLPS